MTPALAARELFAGAIALASMRGGWTMDDAARILELGADELGLRLAAVRPSAAMHAGDSEAVSIAKAAFLEI